MCICFSEVRETISPNSVFIFTLGLGGLRNELLLQFKIQKRLHICITFVEVTENFFIIYLVTLSVQAAPSEVRFLWFLWVLCLCSDGLCSNSGALFSSPCVPCVSVCVETHRLTRSAFFYLRSVTPKTKKPIRLWCRASPHRKDR